MDPTPPTRRPPEPPAEPGREAAAARFAEELGEALLGRLAGIDAPSPRNRLAAVLRARMLQRTRYRPGLEPEDLAERVQACWLRFDLLVRRSRAARALVGLTLVAVLLLAIVPAWIGRRHAQDREADAHLVAGVRPLMVPAVGAEEPLAGEGRGARLTWLASENDLRRLRALCDEREKVALRQRLLKIGGADERTRQWIQSLSAQVAADLDAGSLAPKQYESIEAVSLGLRALLAAGSTTVRGSHRAVVRRALDRLQAVLPELEGPAHATALAACLEAYLVMDGERIGVVSKEIARFTEEQIERIDRPVIIVRKGPHSVFENLPAPRTRRREVNLGPPMNTWSCPLGALADAGVLLRVAPALGVAPERAARVRQAFFDHLQYRGYRSGAIGAGARAALLFSYSDLADRAGLRESLRGYCVNPDRFGRDLRAVHYLAWGIFPGAGWARFNRALRYFTANYADQTPTERAGLLLVQLLYAAPGLAQADALPVAAD